MTVSKELELAIRDYRILLDKGYPEKATLKLVGDRFALSREERMILFRGVSRSEQSAKIGAKLIKHLAPGARIGIDSYNVLFTLYNYRRGRPLFISSDGLLRDVGAVHGRLQRGEFLDEALALLEEMLIVLDPKEVRLWLDAPVSGSGRLAERLRSSLTDHERDWEIHVETVASADPFVREFLGDGIATSDSVVARASKSPIYDLARVILEHSYRAEFYQIRP
jgi:hypothetical protein